MEHDASEVFVNVQKAIIPIREDIANSRRTNKAELPSAMKWEMDKHREQLEIQIWEIKDKTLIW
jgi:hypothetical protein